MNIGFAVIYEPEFVDVVSVIVAAIFSLTVYIRRRRYQPRSRPPAFSMTTALDFATGSALFPMVVLAVSIFDRQLLLNLLRYDRITLTLAAVFAFFAIVDDARRATKLPSS